MGRTLKLVLGGLAAVVVLAVGGTWVFLNVVEDDAPDRLTLQSTGGSGTTATTGAADAPKATTAARDGVDGTWTPIGDSVVGYRVKEVLFGQDKEAVGRTSDVTGSLTIAGGSLTDVKLVVDMTTVSSDQSRRDGQFHGRIMDTAQFPTATFTLTRPLALPADPGDGVTVEVQATGDLTLRGTTKSVTFPLKAQRKDGTLSVNGSIPITFAEWSIPNPSFGPVSTEDHGELEFLVVFAPAS